MALRDRIEEAFARLAGGILNWPRAVIATSVLSVGALATGLPSLEIETSFDSYLPRGNPAQRLYDEFREEFGSGERIVVLLEPESLYDIRFLDELRSLHFALEDEMPYLDDLTSLVDARYLVGDAETLTSEGLLDEPVRDDLDMAKLRDRLRSNPIYRNVIVDRDEASTAIVMEFDGAGGEIDDSLLGFEDEEEPDDVSTRGSMLTTEQSERVVRTLERVLAEHAPSSARLYAAGTPLLAHRLGVMLTSDILMFVSISAVLAALLLAALFRNVWATVHPLLVVGLSLVGTLGWMGHVGIPITAVTEIVPSLLVAIGVGDAVHIQAMFYKERRDGSDVPSAIRSAMGHSGLAVLLTSLTTAASMAAFQAAELQPVIDLGRVAPVGVGLAFVLSTTLLPALLSVTPMTPISVRRGDGERPDRFDEILFTLGRIGTRHSAAVFVATAVVLVVAIGGAIGLRFSQDDLKWLPEDDSVRIGTEALNRSMRGAEPFELYVTVIDEGIDLREPAVVEFLRDLEDRVSAIEVEEVRVAQSLSLVDALEETHRALVAGSGVTSALPDTRAGISQELLLFESAAPDDLARLVDTDWRKTRLTMIVPFVDALYYPQFAAEANRAVEETLETHQLFEAVEVESTGLLMVSGETFQLLFVSMARSYGIAFGVISLLMLVLIGDLRLGLLSVVPNLMPILIVLGLMGWTGASLDISSMLVGGILIGVVVDDTIHFAHNFARYRHQSGCSFHAIRETLATTGRAMLVTSTVLSIGFFSFMGASLANVSDFGLYCGIGVILAFLADMVLFTALITRVTACAPGCTCRDHDDFGVPERRIELRAGEEAIENPR